MSDEPSSAFQAHSFSENPRADSVVPSDQSHPLVSVIVPVFNGEKYIFAAIDSIMGQTYHPLEILVINDGSTDETEKRLSAFGSAVQIFEQPNQGPPSALNKGLSHAAGRFIAFLDADDLWSPQKLSIQVDYLETHPNVPMVFSFLRQFISPELDEKSKQTLICPGVPEPGYVRIALLSRRQVFEQVGIFNPTLRVGEFVDWYMRAKDAGLEAHMLPDVLAMRRLHKTHSNSITSKANKGYVYALKAGLDRRRKAGTKKPISERRLEG
jgi:glycosyltransferase involved in cell wall biosynthesis